MIYLPKYVVRDLICLEWLLVCVHNVHLYVYRYMYMYV